MLFLYVASILHSGGLSVDSEREHRYRGRSVYNRQAIQVCMVDVTPGTTPIQHPTPQGTQYPITVRMAGEDLDITEEMAIRLEDVVNIGTLLPVDSPGRIYWHTSTYYARKISN